MILHILDVWHLRYAINRYYALEEAFTDAADKEAEAVARTLQETGIHTKTRNERDPFAEILRVEAEEDVPLIILGSHGKSGVAEMLLGPCRKSDP